MNVLWDMPVHADKEIKSNRPDIIIKDQDKEEGTKEIFLHKLNITAQKWGSKNLHYTTHVKNQSKSYLNCSTRDRTESSNFL